MSFCFFFHQITGKEFFPKVKSNLKAMHLCEAKSCLERMVVVVVALLFYIHGKHLRSCWDGQLT